MDFIVNLTSGFMNWFAQGGATFTGWVSGIIPQVVCLLTFMNSIIKLIGEEKVQKFAQKMTSIAVLRYSLFPFIAAMFLTNPMAYSFGKFVEEKYKPAFYDACVSIMHSITGLFPHANAGELFVYMGIAAGLQEAGYDLAPLAIRYFIVGIIVITIRGLLTERIYFRLAGIKK